MAAGLIWLGAEMEFWDKKAENWAMSLPYARMVLVVLR